MKKKEIFIVIAILIIKSIFEITGSLLYDVYPAWLWTVCGASNASYLTWKRISVDFLSIGNIICLAIGVVYFIFLEKKQV